MHFYQIEMTNNDRTRHEWINCIHSVLCNMYTMNIELKQQAPITLCVGLMTSKSEQKNQDFHCACSEPTPGFRSFFE